MATPRLTRPVIARTIGPAAEEQPRQHVAGVADDAAQPRKQRPASRRRREADRASPKRRCQERKRESERSAARSGACSRGAIPSSAGTTIRPRLARPRLCMARSANIAPPLAKPVVRGGRGRVVEAGILDRPAHQRKRGGADEREATEAQRLARATLGPAAKGFRPILKSCNDRATHAPAGLRLVDAYADKQG